MIRAQVKKTIESYKLIEKGDRVLVCVSGGPDSMALLYLMASLRGCYNITLCAAHLDHMLRGRESAGDADFVKKAALTLNIPVTCESIDVKRAVLASKMSVEETAREIRYDFYKRAAEKLNANRIATGHTMDDQAETVLMRFIKGSGSLGLSGIPYKRRTGEFQIIRPLLDVTRKSIEHYLEEHGIPSRTDASNFETFYFRNKIRHLLIPLLEKDFNPRIKENLSNIAENLSDEFNYLNNKASVLFKRLAADTKAGIKIRIKELLKRHVVLQRLIIRQIICKLRGGLKGIKYRHWKAVKSLLSCEEGAGIDLPGRIKVVKRQGQLIFTSKHIGPKYKTKFKKTAKLRVQGKTVIPELGIKIAANIVKSAPHFKKGEKNKKTEYIDGNTVRHFLKVRTKRKGDRMKPLGMKSNKKLHDIFVDEKVPYETRDTIPLIIAGNKIVWIVGIKMSDDYKITKGTRRIIKLTARNL